MISRALSFCLKSGALATLLLSLLPLAPQARAASQGSLCVQTFNVYATAYASAVGARVRALGRELVSNPCDSLLFQELWRERDYHNLLQWLQPSRLAPVYADTVRGDGEKSGLAAAFAGGVAKASSTLFQVNNQGGFLDWFREMAGVQKGFLRIEAALPNSPPLLFLSTHTHPKDEAVRTAQMTQIVQSLAGDAAAAEAPLFLGADLNAESEELSVRLLRDVLLLQDSFLAVNPAPAPCTYCAENPLAWDSNSRFIDYILYREAPTVSVRVESSVINLTGEPNAPYSDHYGLRSHFLWEARSAVQLPLDSPIVQDRIAAARATILEAVRSFQDDGRREFGPAIGFLIGLEEALAAGRLPAGLEPLYRLP